MIAVVCNIIILLTNFNMLMQVRQQSKNCRATQNELETDMRNKEYALGIDSMCHQLNNFSKVSPISFALIIDTYFILRFDYRCA